MRKFICLLLMVLIMLPMVVYAGPEVRADSYIVALMDGEQIIMENNPDEKVSPSGFTKIFTALVAYGLKDINETVTVSEEITDYVNRLDITVNLKPGETLSLYDLLGAAVVASANDAAYQIAFTCSGGVDAFVEAMNSKAKELGMNNTNFTNPTGVYDENQYTTPRDMLIMYKEFCRTDSLNQLVRCQNFEIAPTNLSKKRTLWTNNHMRSGYYDLKYYYPNCISGKISSSSEGGYSAIECAAKGEMNVVAVVFNSQYDQNVNYSLVDCTNIFDYIFENYKSVTAVKENQLVCEAKVKNSSSVRHTLVNTNSRLKGIIKNTDSTDKILCEVDMPEYISAPLKKGDVVGKANYIYNGMTLGSVDLVVGQDIGFNVIKYIGNGILWFFGLKAVKAVIAVIVILFLIIAGFIIYCLKVQEEKKRQKRRRDNRW